MTEIERLVIKAAGKKIRVREVNKYLYEYREKQDLIYVQLVEDGALLVVCLKGKEIEEKEISEKEAIEIIRKWIDEGHEILVGFTWVGRKITEKEKKLIRASYSRDVVPKLLLFSFFPPRSGRQ